MSESLLPPDAVADLASQGSWLDRVKNLLGPRGYEPSMRRSIQTLVIHEAKRSIQPNLADMRPYQRKVALLDQAQALVSILDFCLPQHKPEILWRTNTSKEMVSPEICWKRSQLIQKELERLANLAKQFVEPGRGHQEIVDLLEQDLFEKSGDGKNSNIGKLVPPHWGHAHNHVLFCFRLYYKGDSLDPDFPDPVTVDKSVDFSASLNRRGGVMDDMALSATHTHTGAAASPAGQQYTTAQVNQRDCGEERRKTLQEIKDHLYLLKEFEDIADDEEILQRKRDLLAALPPPPPAAKRSRYSS